MNLIIPTFKLITTVNVGYCCYLLYEYYRKKTDFDLLKRLDEEASKHDQTIFFTDSNAQCRRYCLSRKIPCNDNCSYLKLRSLLDLISSAEKTLDICIYLITCNDLANAIIRAHKRGVSVRVIVDDEMSSSTESKVSWFLETGIVVKSLKDITVLMHHKFCILDHEFENRKLATGSLNWTLQGLAGNYEYVSFYSKKDVVDDFANEFNYLWNRFDEKHLKQEK